MSETNGKNVKTMWLLTILAGVILVGDGWWRVEVWGMLRTIEAQRSELVRADDLSDKRITVLEAQAVSHDTRITRLENRDRGYGNQN